jgi:hypothetical protein
MRDWVNTLKSGTIVIVATNDEALNNMRSEGRQALRSIGMAQVVPGFRWAHCGIGVKDAEPGTALERTSPTAAEIHLSPGNLPRVPASRRELVLWLRERQEEGPIVYLSGTEPESIVALIESTESYDEVSGI